MRKDLSILARKISDQSYRSEEIKITDLRSSDGRQFMIKLEVNDFGNRLNGG